MDYLGNIDNLVRTADLEATNVVPSNVVYRTAVAGEGEDGARQGGGVVDLVGPYTGMFDAEYVVEIVDTEISGVPMVSAPVFAGVGNPTMTDVAAEAGVQAQTIVVTLVDVGTRTVAAYAPFQGVTLVAKETGESGNSITISVDTSGYTRTLTDFSTLEDLQAGQQDLTGLQWDWNAAVLTAEGFVPPTAKRIQIGDDPQVLRQFKRYVAGEYVYSFSPPLPRDVDANSKVYEITGTATVTISNGVVTREYTGITTLYSLLAAIQGDAESLVDVDGVVVNDQLPGGMGAVEMSVLTKPFVASINRDGTSYVEGAEIGLTVDATVPTSTQTVRCLRADIPGEEVWGNENSVLGVMDDATTGVPYSVNGIAYTIPVQLGPMNEPGANVKQARLLKRSANEEDTAQLCPSPITLGVEARTHLYRFEWSRKPSNECACPPGGVVGTVNPEILGIEEGDASVSEIPEELRSRAEDLAALAAAQIARSIVLSQTPPFADLSMGEGFRQIALGLEPTFYPPLQAILDALGSEFSDSHPAVAEWDEAFYEISGDLADITDTNMKSVISPSEQAYEDDGDSVKLVSVAGSPEDHAARYLSVWQQRMEQVKRLAGIAPNFEGATLTGNAVWQDRGGEFWWEDLEGRLLPLFNNVINYSAVMTTTDDGRQVPVATREWAYPLKISCEERLQLGDVLEIEIEVTGNLRQTYQPGDVIRADIIRAAPVPLGGGQTGTDVETWVPVGSEDGAFDPYLVNVNDPEPYDADGLSFLITPGAIASGLGATFTFDVEGGTVSVSKDGESPVLYAIAPEVDIGDGLTLTFSPGSAPSFIAGDRYDFTAEAINGPDQARRLSGGFLRMSRTSEGDTPNRLDLHLDAPAVVSKVFLGDHDMPLGATFRLVSSASADFSSPTTDELVVTNEVHNGFVLADERNFAHYRLEFDEFDVSMLWPYLGEGVTPKVETRLYGEFTERGTVTKRRFLASAARRKGTGITAEHVYLRNASVDALMDLLDHASENDAKRVAVMLNGNEEPSQVGVCSFEADFVEITDEFGFAPTSTNRRRQALQLELDPIR